MGCKIMRIHAPVRFKQFLQEGNLYRAQWFPPNKLGKLRYLQDIWLFVLGKQEFVTKVLGGRVNKARNKVFMSRGTRASYFRITHRLWRHMHHHRVGGGGVTTAAAWLVQGVDFGKPSM